MSACKNFNECLKEYDQILAHPVDKDSLYADEIYDDHVGATRCYVKNPINIIEGFGSRKLNRIIRWFIIAIILFVVASLIVQFFSPKKIISLNMTSESAYIPEHSIARIIGLL
uniref:Uncharacterized protein n=1 Tax=Mimivirus LCMiAC01 TaxID=2506608 RepID=A0A481YZX5_9VIRU|nr:MAG: hypothetical protein LCMiAC01_02270 [Mimivirus LCMiAC01]